VERIVEDLRTLRDRIVELRRRLSEVPEGALQLREPYSLEAELAVALECALVDDLEPAIRRLETALAVTPAQLAADWERARQPLPRERPRLDLGRFSESARRAIYEDVLATRFAPLPSSLTPDDFELQVLYLFGRWLVTYRTLREASGPPVEKPLGVLVVGTDEREEPLYTAV
jgi:hypothetical protein